MTTYHRFRFGCAVAGICSLSFPATLAAAAVDLMSSEASWKLATPAPGSQLKFGALKSDPGVRLMIQSQDSDREVGGWVRALPPIEPGQRYHFEATFTAVDIDHPQRHVWAFLTTVIVATFGVDFEMVRVKTRKREGANRVNSKARKP